VVYYIVNIKQFPHLIYNYMARETPTPGPNELTEREQEILRLIATGTSNKEIASQLSISANTVKVHLRNIFTKIGATTRTEAAMYAVRTGLANAHGSELDGNNPPGTPSEGVNLPFDSSNQGEDIPTNKVGIPAESQTATRRIGSWPLTGFRIAGLAALIVILITAVGIGFVVTRQQAAQPAVASRITATPQSRWHKLASLPTARSGLAVTAFENQVYAIGGETDQGVSGSVDRFDPETDAWANVSQKPIPVADVNASVLGGRIYVPGGRTTSGTVTDALEIYDPRQNTWERGTDLPVALSAYAMVAFEGRLYLFGGWDGHNFLNTVFIYHPDSESWSTGKPMPIARAFAGAAIAGGKVYVVGGENHDGKLSVNDVNDLSLNNGDISEWKTDESLPASVSGISLVNVADLIYAVVSGNGVDGIYVFHNLHEANQKNWEFIPMPYKFGSRFNAILLGSKLYIIGGYQGGKALPLNISYDAIYTIVIPITK
jgi:DNA-binding CsgD family transcriptional regulator